MYKLLVFFLVLSNISFAQTYRVVTEVEFSDFSGYGDIPPDAQSLAVGTELNFLTNWKDYKVFIVDLELCEQFDGDSKYKLRTDKNHDIHPTMGFKRDIWLAGDPDTNITIKKYRVRPGLGQVYTVQKVMSNSPWVSNKRIDPKDIQTKEVDQIGLNIDLEKIDLSLVQDHETYSEVCLLKFIGRKGPKIKTEKFWSDFKKQNLN